MAMKPNDFCVNDVKYRCIWGMRTNWDTVGDILKEEKKKIDFMEVIEERGEGSKYAWFRDDEAGINYFIPLGGQQEQREILRNAIQTWGKEAQVDMMIEEMAELTKALLNERRGRESNIAEEMADVQIMLEQMTIIFQNAGEVEQRFIEKTARLCRRLCDRANSE